MEVRGGPEPTSQVSSPTTALWRQKSDTHTCFPYAGLSLVIMDIDQLHFWTTNVAACPEGSRVGAGCYCTWVCSSLFLGVYGQYLCTRNMCMGPGYCWACSVVYVNKDLHPGVDCQALCNWLFQHLDNQKFHADDQIWTLGQQGRGQNVTLGLNGREKYFGQFNDIMQSRLHPLQPQNSIGSFINLASEL